MKIPDWLRWTLVLPCALLTGFIVYPIVLILNEIFCFQRGWLLEHLAFVALASSTSTFACLWVGMKIAPRYKFVVAVVLTTILALIIGFALAGKFLFGNVSTILWSDLIVNAVVTLGVALGIIITIHEQGEDATFF